MPVWIERSNYFRRRNLDVIGKPRVQTLDILPFWASTCVSVGRPQRYRLRYRVLRRICIPGYSVPRALLLERCRVVCRSNSSYLLIASVRAGRRAEAASHARARRLFGSCVRHSWQHRGSHRCTGITNNFGSGFWSAPIFDYTHPKGT